jgi:quercetin dioxygenase-like cupin family protein
MKSWTLHELDLKPRLPEILSSSKDARAVALDLAAGETLNEHEVHERTWLLVLDGEVEVSAAGESASGGVGMLVELAPRERHEVRAVSAARLLLLLTPWPGRGHPGALTLTQKLYARRRAAKQQEGAARQGI